MVVEAPQDSPVTVSVGTGRMEHVTSLALRWETEHQCLIVHRLPWSCPAASHTPGGRGSRSGSSRVNCQNTPSRSSFTNFPGVCFYYAAGCHTSARGGCSLHHTAGRGYMRGPATRV
ncbi:hypothetical protein E2C01_094865 [Portunus trituberculatus]|uniref:Uncharacterized protein n=1 Tax=Portunus trituberculatus TaxID=210409 RepID=A0A5B7JTM2_PORTR|nr:hypothetical protein [Portunus trituberculatus]